MASKIKVDSAVQILTGEHKGEYGIVQRFNSYESNRVNIVTMDGMTPIHNNRQEKACWEAQYCLKELRLVSK